MKYIFFLQILFLFVSYKGYSQQYTESQIDSLLDGIEKFGDSLPNKAIENGLRTYEYSENVGYKKGMAASALLTAKNFFDTNQYDRSLKQVIKAEKAALKIKDYTLLSEINRIKANNYTSLGLYKQAFIEFNKGLKAVSFIENKQDASRQKGLLYNDIAVGYDRSGQTIDSTKKYFTLSYEQFSTIKDNRIRNVNLSLASVNVGSCFLVLKQYDSAKIYFTRAIDLAEKQNYHSTKLYANLNLGNLESELKNYEKAVFYYQKALVLAQKIKKSELQREVYLLLSKTYEELDDEKMEAIYYKKYFSVNDSLQKRQKKAAITTVTELIEEEKEKAKKLRKIGIFILIMGGLFTIVILIKAIQFYNKKKKATINILEKQEELNTKEELLKKVTQHSKTSLVEVLELAKKDNPKFLSKFEEIHYDFYHQLIQKYPSLLTSEIKVCAYLKLGYQIKDIALFTNVTVRSVEARIYRIRKKVNLSKEKDFSLWIIDFDA